MRMESRADVHGVLRGCAWSPARMCMESCADVHGVLRGCAWNPARMWMESRADAHGVLRGCGWNPARMCIESCADVDGILRGCGWNPARMWMNPGWMWMEFCRPQHTWFSPLSANGSYVTGLITSPCLDEIRSLPTATDTQVWRYKVMALNSYGGI